MQTTGETEVLCSEETMMKAASEWAFLYKAIQSRVLLRDKSLGLTFHLFGLYLYISVYFNIVYGQTKSFSFLKQCVLILL